MDPPGHRPAAGEYRNFLDDRWTRLSGATWTLASLSSSSPVSSPSSSSKPCAARCSYLQAVLLMDAYLKNPRNGKALILRR